MKGGDFMGIEDKIGEQDDPAEVAIAEQQGSVDPAFIDAIRAVVENASAPTTHPLRRGRIRISTGSEVAVAVDPQLGQP